MASSAYKEHIVKSKNQSKVIWANKFLIKHGWLIPDKGGKSSQNIKNQRHYVLKDPERENISMDIENLFTER